MNLYDCKKILIIRLSSLGDILLSTPLIRTIKKKYPDIKIDFLLKEQYKDLLSCNPYLEKLFFYQQDKEELNSLIEKLKNENYDLIIDLQNNLRSAQIRKILKVKSVKFNKKNIDKFLLVNFKINLMKNAETIPQRYADSVDLKLDDEGLDLFTLNKPSNLFEENIKYIGFAPGSRHFTKMWLKEYYIELGNLLNQKGYKIALLGGKDDKNICSEISSKITDSINLSNDDDILQIAADMKKCLAVICNDSGLMHAACAVKIPVLTFFGSTVREFGFTPYKNKNIILENTGLSCRPCTHIGKSYCPKGHFKCMKEISPKSAFENLIKLINS